MKHLQIKSSAYIYLEKSFGQWLDILGYASGTVYYLPLHVREYLHWMEQQGCTQIHQIDTPLILKYYTHLSQRKNQRRGGGLSASHLNKHLLALNKLFEYLRKNAKLTLPLILIEKEKPDTKPITPLTTDQIKKLYEATQTYEAHQSIEAQQDQAILAIFYACGLRRTEGVRLNICDVNLDNRLLHVRHAKGGQPRFVPFNKSTAIHLADYLHEARPHIAQRNTHVVSSFFLTNTGRSANGGLLSKRLKYMQTHTDDASLKHLNIHLHLLRHSIATHLLFEGLTLEKVAQFLGHKSLTSTQIYTHIMEQVYGEDHPPYQEEQPFSLIQKKDPSRAIKTFEDER